MSPPVPARPDPPDPPDPLDPQGLIREAFLIEAPTPGECRAIFFDWSLHLSAGTDAAAAIRVLLARHGRPGHPMTAVLEAGLAPPPAPARRGGWRARRGPGDG